MRRLVVFGLVFSFSQSLIFAAGPLEESARSAAQQLAQNAGPVSNHSNKGQYLWSGAAVAGTGAVLMILGRNKCETQAFQNVPVAPGVVVTSGSLITCAENTAEKAWANCPTSRSTAVISRCGSQS